jgi:hypothetical protein
MLYTGVEKNTQRIDISQHFTIKPTVPTTPFPQLTFICLMTQNWNSVRQCPERIHSAGIDGGVPNTAEMHSSDECQDHPQGMPLRFVFFLQRRGLHLDQNVLAIVTLLYVQTPPTILINNFRDRSRPGRYISLIADEPSVLVIAPVI